GPYAAVIPLFVQAALENKSPFINGDGKTTRDFTFVENAIQANVKALLDSKVDQSIVINIACGEKTSLNELWNKISSIAGTEKEPEYRSERKGDVKHSLADIRRASEVIGYIPSISVTQGLKILIDINKS